MAQRALRKMETSARVPYRRPRLPRSVSGGGPPAWPFRGFARAKLSLRSLHAESPSPGLSLRVPRDQSGGIAGVTARRKTYERIDNLSFDSRGLPLFLSLVLLDQPPSLLLRLPLQLLPLRLDRVLFLCFPVVRLEKLGVFPRKLCDPPLGLFHVNVIEQVVCCGSATTMRTAELTSRRRTDIFHFL